MSWYPGDGDMSRSPTEIFAGFTELGGASDDWNEPKIDAVLAFRRLEGREGTAALIRHLTSGMIRAYSQHAFVEWRRDEDKYFNTFRELRIWLSAGKWRGDGGSDAFHCRIQVPRSFWEMDHAKAGDWTGGYTLFDPMTSANWDRGEFGSVYARYADAFASNDSPEKSAIGLTIYYDVKIQRSDFVAVFGEMDKAEATSRTGKYDWERAIAAFCGAQVKSDLLPDIYVHGAQASIENWLRNWFARSGATPSEGMLRNKARLILSEMKAADKTR